MAWDPISSLKGPPGDDADVTAHEAASDPHPQYMTSTEVSSAIAGKADKVVAFTLTYASTLTPNANNGSLQKCALTGNPTLMEPTNGTNDQMLLLEFSAVAEQTITFDSGLEKLDFIGASLTVKAGKKGYVGIKRGTSATDWTIISSGAS